MKLQRTPLILLLIALALGSFVYFYEVRGAPQREAAKTETQKLFAFQENQVRSLSVKTAQQTVTFERNSEAQAKTDQSKWRMKAPTDTPASEASVAYLLNLLATGSSDRRLTAPVAQQADFGFNQPLATIEVKLDNQQTHRLIVGKPDFNNKSLYAQVDPPEKADQLSVVLVSKDFENAVNRPIAEWKHAADTPPGELSKPQGTQQ